jgi:hypothetical protein
MADDQATNAAEEVQSHATGVVVWDVPSAIVAGERFRISVGAKCASECRLATSRIGIYDHAGARLASATLPDGVWPGTTGLYAAEVELTAPGDEGLFTWSVRAPEGDAAGAHAEGAATFGVRVVRQPDHLITVEAVDGETQAPLADARVVMHPYHATTDAHGVARLRVAKGSYRLFVSQTRYMTVGASVEVAGDVTTKAELFLEPELERN